jgi:Midasin AAA lid domain
MRATIHVHRSCTVIVLCGDCCLPSTAAPLLSSAALWQTYMIAAANGTEFVKHVGALHPAVPEPLRRRMATFLADLHHAANVARTFGSAGGPWEFNLRDLLRWCQLAEGAVPAGGVSTLEGAAQVG